MALVLQPTFHHDHLKRTIEETPDQAPDDWVWDSFHKAPEVSLSSDFENVYFYTDPVDESTGTAGVRGTKPFTEGEHYWEIIFLEAPIGTSVMVGIGTKEALLSTSNYQFVNLLGLDANSWGLSYKGTIWHNGTSKQYCEPFFDKTTVIGCHLNLYSGTLTFYQNGVNLGVAFHGLDKISDPLYPIVSSTATETELGLGRRKCRYLSLQEKCRSTILRQMHCQDSVDNLPLPKIMKNFIKGC